MKKVLLGQWERFFRFRNEGLSVEHAARRARLSTSAAFRFSAGDPSSTGIEAATLLGVDTVGGALVQKPYTPEARQALDDFAYFRLRYFGRRSTPWQERAAYEVLRLLDTDDREYLVLNMPPGSGKSTLFTHDLIAWLIARDRTIRIMVGSQTGRQARMYLSRLKKTLERELPLRADVESLSRGLAWDAEATLAADFGAFKPERRSDVWAASQFTVRQHADVSLDDKEPTVSAWGRDEKFLGGRFDLCVWDDLVGRRTTAEAFDQITDWWLTEAETRLEPGGVMLLQGQRMYADDLYKFCLDVLDDTDTPKYQHIVYPAHDEQRCTGEHDNLRPWPDSCLLDPHRLPWKMLRQIAHANPRVFAVQYQQTDGAGSQSLVDPIWLQGGTDTDGLLVPGCYDTDRDLGQFDRDDAEGWSVVSVDPSPTEWWSIQWWLIRPEVNRYVLVDKVRAKMQAPDFLSLDLDTHAWSGVLHGLLTASRDLGAPITHVVVEVNAAQRYLLTQPHVQKWQAAHAVTLIPHQTHSNKNDPKYGVTSIADFFRQGKIRLPFASGAARLSMSNYVHELTRWPDARTDDEVMATWFVLKAVETNYTPRTFAAPHFARPEWIAPGYAERGLPTTRPRDTPAERLMRAYANR